MADAPTVVVGGGLAGVSAALRLADLGRRVVLVEKRVRLGGAAFSFARGTLSVDNGQHVFLRCCTAYRWFVDRVGAQELVVLQDSLEIPVLAAGGRRARLRRTPGVPAPVHLTAALAGYGLLERRDRLRAVRGALALRRLNPRDRRLDARTLGEFLRAHGQNDATIGALWGILATATLNIDPDEASLALAARVFRTGLLDSARAGDVGRLHDEAAAKALADAGVEVLTDTAVRKVVPGAPVEVAGPHGARSIGADAVVLALPPREAFQVAPALARSGAAMAESLGTSPIVNVHVVYRGRVTDLPFAAAVHSPIQWFFDRTATSGLADQRPGAQYLAVTVSAATGLIDEPSKTVVERFIPELARLLPTAGRAQVVDAFVTRERRATFRQAAGSWPARPATTDGPAGVFLAGAWTDTGWPDTMEGAVRSGVTAAEAVAGTPTDETENFEA